MTIRAAVLLLLIAAESSSVQYFRYDRPVLNTPVEIEKACVTLDPEVFAHSGPRLASLRLYNGEKETPYEVHTDNFPPILLQTATPLNAGIRSGATTFDAEMTTTPYRTVELSVNAQNFIAAVHVFGSQAQIATHFTDLGAYTIFDFTRQKLGRSTILHLPQSDFRYLHFRIDGPIRPDQVTALSIGLATARPLQYVTFVTSSSFQQRGRDTVVELSVPADVPVERILFTPGTEPGNFSRDVMIKVSPANMPPSIDNEEPPVPTFSGNILRIHTTQEGKKIDEEHLAIEAGYVSMSPIKQTAKWTITIHNQDDAPIELNSVSLQMIAHALCFNSIPGEDYKLYYGDAALSTPHYDYAAVFGVEKRYASASLGPEEENPKFQPRPDQRPFTEKHPALLWTALIAAIFLLGVIAFRSSRQLKQPQA